MKNIPLIISILAFVGATIISGLLLYSELNPFELISYLIICCSLFLIGISNKILLQAGKHSHSITFFSVLVVGTTVLMLFNGEFYMQFWNFSAVAHLFIITFALLEFIPKVKNQLIRITRVTTITTALLFGIILIAKLQTPALFGILKVLLLLTTGFQIVAFFSMKRLVKQNVN